MEDWGEEIFPKGVDVKIKTDLLSCVALQKNDACTAGYKKMETYGKYIIALFTSFRWLVRKTFPFQLSACTIHSFTGSFSPLDEMQATSVCFVRFCIY